MRTRNETRAVCVSSRSEVSQGQFLNFMVFSAIGTYFAPLGGNQGQEQQAVSFVSFLDCSSKQLKRRLLYLELVFCGLWLLEEAKSTQMRKAIYVYILINDLILIPVCAYVFAI